MKKQGISCTQAFSQVLEILLILVMVTIAAHAQAPAGCYLQPWIANAGDANLTVCSKGIAGCVSSIGNAAASGGVAMAGFSLPQACTTSKVEYIVKTVDTSALHHYALGLVCHSGSCNPGALYLQTGSIAGPQFTPAGKVLVSQTWRPTTVDGCTSVPCTLPAGVYGLVVGSDCTGSCAVLYGDSDAGTLYAFDVSNTSLNSPWIFDPGVGLPSFFTNMPDIYPVGRTNSTSGLPKPPVVLIY